MKRRQHILIIAALVATALAATACSQTATNSNNANTATNTSTTRTANTTTTTSTSTSNSPAGVLQASFEAAKRKDVAAFKRSIASADMKELEEAVNKGGQNLDDLLKQQLERPETPMPDKLETRNEKIDGEKATVEYKDVRGTWKTANFVKEGGDWKIKLDDAKAEQPAAKKDSGATDDEQE